MENLINTTALTALAAEVDGKFAAILADLVDIETRAATAFETADNEWKATSYNSKAAYADRDLAHDVHDGIESVRRQVTNYQERIAKSVKRFDKEYAEIEAKRLTDLNIEAAKTAEAIDCGFTLLSAHIALHKGKATNIAAVVYMVDGVAYEAKVEADATTGELKIHKGWSHFEGAQVLGEGKENHRKWFFWAEMTPEQIGKAVDLKTKIIRAARTQFDALPRKRR
ncbi:MULTISPECIES: hypothetical protein [unclassified Rhizobium]|uniref:hypothetical protein n=1 Tax=unclassified Rhizobium TaxID=2613769 RepID=UPI0007EB123E|nr:MULTISPECIES: hypothetical protein [unclassified Rhizobium]ANL12040.1 hypothetical protein AMJ98_PA00094 [Rhizobium sp. N1341]ANM42885.1 hypothetical protein AMK03_PA00094 [Rhizobium sp. N741]